MNYQVYIALALVIIKRGLCFSTTQMTVLRNFSIIRADTLNVEKNSRTYFYIGIYAELEFDPNYKSNTFQFAGATGLTFYAIRIRWDEQLISKSKTNWRGPLNTAEVDNFFNHLKYKTSYSELDVFVATTTSLQKSYAGLPLFLISTQSQRKANVADSFQPLFAFNEEVERKVLQQAKNNNKLNFIIAPRNLQMYETGEGNSHFYRLLVEPNKNNNWLKNPYFNYSVEFITTAENKYLPHKLHLEEDYPDLVLGSCVEKAGEEDQKLNSFAKRMKSLLNRVMPSSVSSIKYKVPGMDRKESLVNKAVVQSYYGFENFKDESLSYENSYTKLLELLAETSASKANNTHKKELEYNKTKGLKLSLFREIKQLKGKGIDSDKITKEQASSTNEQPIIVDKKIRWGWIIFGIFGTLIILIGVAGAGIFYYMKKKSYSKKYYTENPFL